MNVLTLSSGEVLSHAARGFESALAGMKPENLVDWDALGLPKPEILDGEYMRGLDHDTRRTVLDKLHDISMLPVYEGNRPHERDAMHAAIAPESREAKWRYMLALVNDTYDMGLDYVDLEVLTPMFRQLATIERGATNIHMPTTHKLRHNPSIHSLHVAGLAYDLLEKAMEHEGLAQSDREELVDARRQLMRSALVHDMGELKGELSVASDRGNMSAVELAAFEANRGLTETEVFTQGLDARLEELRCLTWPADMLEEKRNDFIHSYEGAEHNDNFMGLVHKVLERVQSQHDYLRFEKKDFTPPLATIPQGRGDHKEFMFHYASDPFKGEARGEHYKESLKDLSRDYPNPRVANAMMAVLNTNIDALQNALGKALDFKPRSHADRVSESRSAEKLQAGAAR